MHVLAPVLALLPLLPHLAAESLPHVWVARHETVAAPTSAVVAAPTSAVCHLGWALRQAQAYG